MAGLHDRQSEVTDIVICPICQSLLQTPKSLRCLHTFCLKCIECHCRGNEPTAGYVAGCPLCKEKFNIPEEGVRGLVCRRFIADLVEARMTARDVTSHLPCEVCFKEYGNSNKVVCSTMYCVDCAQKLCERCSRPHRVMKGGPHNVEPINSELEAAVFSIRGQKCDTHSDDYVQKYCVDCKRNLCLVCFAEEHQQHKCEDASAAADKCVKKIDVDLGRVQKRVVAARKEIFRLDMERRNFLAGVEDLIDKIKMKGDEMKRFVDAQVNELMLEVQSLKTETCKEIESLTDSMHMKLLMLNTYSAYCSELKLKGKPSHVTGEAYELHTRATELLQNVVKLNDYCAPTIMFTPTKIKELIDIRRNFVGRVTAPRVVHTLPATETVWGVTSLHDELYVLHNKYKEQVDIYNTTKTTKTTTLYTLLRKLSLSGAEHTCLCDMTSCKHYRCLYIADYSNRCVHRVQLSGRASKLSVNIQPRSLSVTSQFTVLVTCLNDSNLLELTTEGKQLREINLQLDIVHPQHAVQLPNGQFVVCHGFGGDPVHRVCIVDTNGQVTQSYGGPPSSSTVKQLNAPVHLAVDKDGFIFVADNYRVLLRSPTLKFKRVSEIVASDQLRWKPERLFLDVDRRRLYVADGCGVIVVQL